MLFAVLATGPSMSQDVADYVRGKCRAVAVSNAYLLAPWADALVSNDSAWWRFHKDALQFSGRRFAGMTFAGCERIGDSSGGQNSGLQAMRVAHQVLGATRILLLGFDMHGSHYFGPHPAPLKNTPAQRFLTHIAQFNKWEGCEVINCTPGSKITRFPFADVHDLL